MWTFFGGLALLVIGYFTYGAFVEKNFKIDPERKTPAEVLQDGYDYIPMSKKKNGLIELLNIAGTGPIFGPIMGALYGPVAYIWIIVGCIFGGAVHDYMIGMISLRNNGAQFPTLTEKYLGKSMKHIVNIFTMLLMMLVATVFVATPANLMADITPSWFTVGLAMVFIYLFYLVFSILPIDKAMGKLYPWFGAALILSTVGIGFMVIIRGDLTIPNLTFESLGNFHPEGTPIFPALFFTISCGALSGFHSTQAPMVARTMKNEREGRFTFYGMMLAEGAIAMIWAAATMAIFDGQTLSEMIASGTPSVVVNTVSYMLLGNVFGTIAILGVIALPLSTGLSAFRSFRTVMAEYIGIKQDTVRKILMITIPAFLVSFILTQIDFSILWRYFNWANQVMSAVSLLISTRYLYLKSKNYIVTLVPGIFILYAVVFYILSEPIGFGMGITGITHLVGLALTIGIMGIFWYSGKKQKESLSSDSLLINDQLPIETVMDVESSEPAYQAH